MTAADQIDIHAIGEIAPRQPLPAADWRLIHALHDGLPWVPRPYHTVGDAAGISESAVLATLERWLGDGTLRRFGVVVRHRELGYRANTMCVWAVPPEQVSALGHRLASHDGVSLCYRRQTSPDSPYSLFCMIHGQPRDAVETRRAELIEQVGLDAFPAACCSPPTATSNAAPATAPRKGLAASAAPRQQ